MIKFFKNFRKDESGAVTVDWVVLTAAVVALAAVAYGQISQGTSDIAGNISSALSNTDNLATGIGSAPTTP